MCFLPALAGMMGLGGAGAAAAGTAAAAGAAGAGMSLGTALAAGGSLLQGAMGLGAAAAQRKALAQQAETEARLTAVKDNRQRDEFARAMAQQRAELAARGISLDSPTALALGREAAAEMSFDSQAIRSGGMARQQELSAESRMAAWKGVSSMLKGGFDAAGSILQQQPELWPGFKRNGGKVLA